jgi:hypothetical protein
MAKVGRGAITLEMRGLREMKATFKEINKAIGIPTRRGTSFIYQMKKAGQSVTEAYEQAALLVRNKARRNAESGGAPRRLYTGNRPAIFAFFDFDAASDDRRKRSSMVGVRTGLSYRAKDERLYIRWGRGAKRDKDGSIAAGGLSMSMGALFERGTKNRRVRPIRYFKSAILSTRVEVIRLLKHGYSAAISSINAHLKK